MAPPATSPAPDNAGVERDTGVEYASGKAAKDENFPVGSWLLPRHLRGHVARYYDFARAADDISDNGDLPPEEKVRRLDAFARAVESGDADPVLFAKPLALRESLIERGIPFRHATDLCDAFKQDAVQLRYRTWEQLIDYCERSANPVGRFLLDLHGESVDGYRQSDALCSALQVLNHLQDAKSDHAEFDRVYLPLDWMDVAGASIDDLRGREETPALRRVIDQCLDGCEALMAVARDLVGALNSRALAAESAVIVRLADRLTWRLRRGDPIKGRVKLTKLDFLVCGVTGAFAGWFSRRPSAPPAAHPAARREV